jgi:hypothetical protein
MPDSKDTNQKTAETLPDAETPKKPTQVVNEPVKPNTQPTVVPNPQDLKEPAKKSA